MKNPNQYQETTNTIKFRDGSFIIVVVDYGAKNKLYRYLMDSIPERTYIPKNKRWYIKEIYYLYIIELKRNFGFYITKEAVEKVKQLYQADQELEENYKKQHSIN